MTDQPASRSEPSMEDILASIRQIMDDDDSKASVSPNEDHALQSAESTTVGLFSDEDIDPAEETIFPERGGLLWRRVSGRGLADGDQDGPGDDELLELTDLADISDEDEYELNELLDEAAGISEEEGAALEAVARSVDLDSDYADAGEHSSDSSDPEEESSSDLILTLEEESPDVSGADENIAAKTSSYDDEEEVLDLTRRVTGDVTIDDVADSMAGPEAQTTAGSGYVSAGLTGAMASQIGFGERHDGEPEEELEESYEEVLRPNSGYDLPSVDDDHERALDARFYDDKYDEDAPETDGDYAQVFGAKPPSDPTYPAREDDELDTVGGMVREALRSRNPAIVSSESEESASRALATLAKYDGHTPRRTYGQLRITDDDDAPTVDAVVREELRPLLREWLNENLPTVVESLVKQEVERISARSRRFVRREDD